MFINVYYNYDLHVVCVCYTGRSPRRVTFEASSNDTTERPHDDDKQFENKRNLNDHMMTHNGEKKYPCPRCDERFIDRCDVASHFSRFHSSRFGCGECGKLYLTGRALSMHRLSHSKPADESPESRDSPSRDKVTETSREETYRCPQCPNQFGTQAAVTLHLSKFHEGDHKCDECERRFLNSRVLAMHRRLSHSTARDISSASKDGCHDQELTDAAEEEMCPCPHCDRQFRTQQAVNLHVGKFHGRGKCRCDECGRLFRSSLILATHRRSHAMVSDKSSVSKDGSNDRKVMDTGDGEMYQCLQCENQFGTQAAVNLHMDKYHGRKYGCDECGKHFVTSRALSMHCISQHRSSVSQYNKCDQCERHFRNSQALRMHSMMSHASSASKDASNDQEVMETAKEDSHPCPQCEQQYTTQAAVNLHMDKYHGGKYRCDQCGKHFVTSRSLAMHSMRLNHSRASDVSSTGKDCWHVKRFHGGTYNCDQCGKHFLKKPALAMHCMQSHPTASDKSSTSQDGGPNDQELTDAGEEELCPCLQCDQQFRTLQALKMHAGKYHGNGKSRCNECGKLFASNQVLALHKQTHSKASQKSSVTKEGSGNDEVTETVQEELYPCPQCEEQFRTQAAMNWHLKNFHRDDYKCDECGKQFKSNPVLAIHKRTHAKASDKTSTSKDGLSDQELTDDEEELYPCPQCKKQFRMQLALNWHVKKFHLGNYTW